MWNDFRKFIARGSVVDLAIALVIGVAFKDVVDSFVADILMPPIGLLLGGVDFSDLYVSLTGVEYESLAAAEAAGAPTIDYGQFLNHVIAFLIVAFALFLLIRGIVRLYAREQQVPAPDEKQCPHCRLTVPMGATRCGHCTSELQAA